MSRLRQVGAFSSVVLRLMARDPSSAFFMLFLPIAVIVIVGAAYGGQGQLRLGLVDGGGVGATEGLAAQLGEELGAADGVTVDVYDDVEQMRADIRRFELAGGVIVPDGIDEQLAAGPVDVGLVVLPTGSDAFATRTAVQSALEVVGARVTAARLVAEATGVDPDEARAAAAEVALRSSVEVVGVDVDDASRDLSRYALTAPQNLVLFSFIISLTSSGLLVVARRDHVLRRSLAAPVPIGSVVAGLALGWFALALVQSLLIIVVGAVFFGVSWGDPVAAGLLVVTFALVGCGAGLLVGAVARDVDRVSAVTPIVGIVLAALGGCMMPLEIFPPAMLAIAHAVPHYWAMTGWQELVFDGGGVGDISGSLAVLIGFGVVLIGVASALLRRDLASPPA